MKINSFVSTSVGWKPHLNYISMLVTGKHSWMDCGDIDVIPTAPYIYIYIPVVIFWRVHKKKNLTKTVNDFVKGIRPFLVGVK